MPSTRIRWRRAAGPVTLAGIAACLLASAGPLMAQGQQVAAGQSSIAVVGPASVQDASANRPENALPAGALTIPDWPASQRGASPAEGQPPESGQQAPTPGMAGATAQLTALVVAPEQPQGPVQGRPAQRDRYRLEIPANLPGANAPAIQIPPFEPNQPNLQRQAALEGLLGPLPPITRPGAEPQPGPAGRPLTLADLQSLAYSHSPAIRQAEADVQSARGAMIQAGMPQNPTFGFEGDTIGTGHTGGYQGAALEQVVPTGGKLQLARESKCADLKIAELTLRRAGFDLFTEVRSRYFAVLVALEEVRIYRGLAELTERVYSQQVKIVMVGEAAPYEALQVRVLAIQARAPVVQAYNDYASAWRRLAATLNAPEMPPTQLAGSADVSVPNILYEAAWHWMLEHHSQLGVARNVVYRARCNLALARRVPWIPDLDVAAVVQRDYTTPDIPTVYSLKATVPLPLIDRNRGNIMAAEGDLIHQTWQFERTRDTLIATLADAYARYDTNRKTVDFYRGTPSWCAKGQVGAITDQIRAFPALFERYHKALNEVAFGDVVQAEQTLVQTYQTYVQTLAAMWQAVVDVSDLLEVEDPFQAGNSEQLPSPQPMPQAPQPAPQN
jgi:cobalt-zinc-cadmium efflux system outer membrane protein